MYFGKVCPLSAFSAGEIILIRSREKRRDLKEILRPSPQSLSEFFAVDAPFYTLDDFSVRFAETDAAGLVHFTHFLRWAENAEGDFFRTSGLSVLQKNDAGTLSGFPRVAVRANFCAPARYADRIRVQIRPQASPEENARSLSWEFRIFRVETDETQTLLAEGTWKTVFALISRDGKIQGGNNIPEYVVKAVKNFFYKK